MYIKFFVVVVVRWDGIYIYAFVRLIILIFFLHCTNAVHYCCALNP